MSKRLGLGRGLDALIPTLEVSDEDKVIEISLQQLRPNPYQPRKTFDEDAIQELAETVKKHGIIQPIIVRFVMKDYEIIAGERRFRAAQLCGLQTIPAIVKNLSDEEAMVFALIENLQRENLNAIETAMGYDALMKKCTLTQEELSLQVGKSRSHIANFLRLLTLPEEVKNNVSRGTLSMGHARALAALKDDQQILDLMDIIINQNWSVRELEAHLQQLEQSKVEKKEIKATKVKKDPYIVQIEESLREQFKTTVNIRSKKDKGTVEIFYFNEQDLQRILDLLQKN